MRHVLSNLIPCSLPTDLGQPSLAEHTLTNDNDGFYDAFLMTGAAANGAPVWSTSFGGDGHDVPTSLRRATDGAIVIAGHFASAEMHFGRDGPHPCPARLSHAPPHLTPLDVTRDLEGDAGAGRCGAARRRFIGCYVEKEGDYDFPIDQGKDEHGPMTPLLCQQLCNGYEYFALVNGGQCRCSDSYGRHGPAVTDSLCDIRCDGDVDAVCGGDWHRQASLT